MEFLNIDSYMESLFKDSTEPILSYSKNNEPRIDRIPGKYEADNAVTQLRVTNNQVAFRYNLRVKKN